MRRIGLLGCSLLIRTTSAANVSATTLFSDSLVALRADTGARVWHFQTVHHDLWDYDVASPPILFDWYKDGRTIAAVGVASKTGHQ